MCPVFRAEKLNIIHYGKVTKTDAETALAHDSAGVDAAWGSDGKGGDPYGDRNGGVGKRQRAAHWRECGGERLIGKHHY